MNGYFSIEKTLIGKTSEQLFCTSEVQVPLILRAKREIIS